MPPKKKKPPPRLKSYSTGDEDQDLVDIFGYIELIQDCLEQAEENESVCLKGILKADIALRQIKEDADIQCIVLMKRAELLYIAVKNNYDTEELSGAHEQPLDSCIEDCEHVLSKVSSTDSAKPIREKAASLLADASQLKKTFQREARAKRTQNQQKINGESKRVSHGVFQRYNPSKTLFKHISKINSYLLQDIADCFKKAKTICRTCYFKHSRVEYIGAHNRCKVCKRSAVPLALIPASRMCDNLAGSKYVAIPPPPKMLMAKTNKHKLFQMCKNKDHTLCCDKSAIGETWFAHSIEELVIWTVERHFGCNFTEYLQHHHKESESPNHRLFDQLPQAITTNGGGNYYIESSDDSGKETEDEFEYYPEECVFKNVASIPQRLLLDVIEMYHGVKEYCKWCFYKENKMCTITFDKSFNCTVCSKCHKDWKPVVVVHASQLCWNFGRFDYLPIAPWPQGKPIKDSFEYCQKKDHFRCFRVYIETEFWYPHTVEEMIIWTVERERSCTFSKFIESLSRIPEQLIPPGKTNSRVITPTATPNSSTQSTPSHSPMKKVGPSLAAAQKVHVANSTSTPAGSVPNRARQQPQPVSKVPPVQSKVTTSNHFVSQKVVPNTTNPMKTNLVQNTTVGGVTVSSSARPPNGTEQSFQYARLVTTAGLAVKLTDLQIKAMSQRFGQSLQGQVSMPGSTSPFVHVANHDGMPVYTHQQPIPSIGTIPGQTVTSSYKELGYTPSSIPGTSLYKELGYTPSSNPGFNKARTIQVTTVGITMSSTPRALYGSAIATISEIGGGMHSSGRQNYKVAPLPVTAINNGRQSMTYEVQALSKTPLTTVISPPARNTQQVLKFSEVNFKQISDIPLTLLREIATCFNGKKEICRLCFYEERVMSVLVQATNKCDNGEHQWNKPLLVIPGCILCDNEPCFERGDHLPIPPLPPVATIKKCQQKNHHKCYTKSLKSNEMFAHSVEALVVWIVESEEECSFEEYAMRELLVQPVTGHNGQAPSTKNVAVRTPPPNLGAPLPISPGPIATAPRISVTSATISNKIVPQNKPVATNVTKSTSGKMYQPKGLEFVTISDIPIELVVGVAECFKSVTFVCRVCYFESDCKILIKKVEVDSVFVCPNGHSPWKQIKVIRSCSICVSPSEWIPIPPLPKHMKQSKTPFVICKKEDHHTCYAMSKGTNSWFPHTVEEMVIWTVERDTGQPYEAVYERYLPTSPKEQVSQPLPQDSTSSRRPTQAREQKPPGFIHPYPGLPLPPKQGTGPYLNRVPLGSSFIPGVGLQSPTFKLDLEQAIKLASSSATASEQSHPPKVIPQKNLPTFAPSRYNDLYGTFPSLVPNLLPDSGSHPPFQGTSTASGGNSMGLNSFVPPQTGPTTDDTLGFFPALLGSGTSDSTFNLDSSDPFMNSGSFTALQFGQHGEIGDKLSVSNWDPSITPDKNEPVSQDWNKAPLKSPQRGGSNIQQQDPEASSDNQTVPPASYGQAHNNSSRQSKKSPPYGKNSIAIGDKVTMSQQKRTTSNPNAKSVSTSDSLELPRMPNSKPFVLEKASEVDPQEGFIEVKSRRKRRAVVNSTKPIDPSSPKNASKAKLTKQQQQQSPRFAGLDRTNNGFSNHRETVPQAFHPSIDVSVVKNQQSSIKSKLVDGRESTEPANQSKPAHPRNSTRDQAMSNGPDISLNGSQLGDERRNKSEKSSDKGRLGSTASSDPELWDTASNQSTKESSSGGNGNVSSGSQDRPSNSLSNGSHAEQIIVTEQQSVPLSSNKSTQIAVAGSATIASSDPQASNVQRYLYACLICYEGFSASDDFVRHCQSGSHCGAVVMTTGGDKLPKYAPPHPKEDHMKLCKKYGNGCPGGPYCKLAHSQEQLSEWKHEWALVRGGRREVDVADLSKLSPSVKNTQLVCGLRLSQLQSESEYPGVLVTMSRPCTLTVPQVGDDVEWTITLQGQNWQKLFGVCCHTPVDSSSTPSLQTPVFNLTSITSESCSILVTGPTWEAENISQGYLLGTVVVTVIARLSSLKSGGLEECELRLNLGYREYLYLPLAVTKEVESVIDKDNQHKAKNATGPSEEESVHLKPFVPQRKWKLSQGSDSSDELGIPNIEGEDMTLMHVPIEDWGCSLTDDTLYLK